MKCQFLVLLALSVSIVLYSQNDYVGKKLTEEQCVQMASKNKEAGDLKEATRYLNAAAITTWENKEYVKAIDYFNQSIEINKQINNHSGISKLNSNLGMIYSDQGEYEKSLHYFQLSLDYRLKHGEKSEIISTYINKGVVLNNLKKHQEAASNLEEALRLATEMNDASSMKSCYGMLAETYEKAGNRERTTHYFNLYRTFHEMIQRTRVNEAKKETEAAELKALQLELEKKEKEIALFNTTRELALTEEEIKKLDSEVRTLMEGKTKQELAMKVLEHELELNKLRIADADATSREQRTLIITTIVGFVGLIFYAVLMLRNAKFKKKVNMQLWKQNEEIKTLNENLESEVQKRTFELHQTLLKLEKRNKDLDQFSHIISHNLRGPVASILGLGNVLNQNNPADTVNIQVFKHLLSATQNLDTVVKDLSIILDVKDNQNMTLNEVDLRDAFKKTSQLLQDEIKKNNIKIETDFASTPVIQSVRPYVESILYNLLSNAIKYRSKNDPFIEVSSASKNGTVYFYVKDNGAGIDPQDMDKIFLPYKRLQAEGEGKGLGLYMVKTQVEALGGSIEVLSERGNGSLFTICLPNYNLN